MVPRPRVKPCLVIAPATYSSSRLYRTGWSRREAKTTVSHPQKSRAGGGSLAKFLCRPDKLLALGVVGEGAGGDDEGVNLGEDDEDVAAIDHDLLHCGPPGDGLHQGRGIGGVLRRDGDSPRAKNGPRGDLRINRPRRALDFPAIQPGIASPGGSGENRQRRQRRLVERLIGQQQPRD